MKKWKNVVMLSALVFSVGNAFALDGAKGIPELQVYSSEDETRVERTKKGCLISLERRPVEPDLLRVRIRSAGREIDSLYSRGCQVLELQAKAAILGQLFEELVPDPDDRQTVRSLAVGRLQKTFPEIAKRLAKEAADHPDWPAVRKRERLSPGSANGFLAKLGNEADVYPELKAALAKVGYQVHLSGMEKVRIRPAKDLKYYDWLQEQGIDPDMDVPFGAVTWFHLKYGPTKAEVDLTPVE